MSSKTTITWMCDVCGKEDAFSYFEPNDWYVVVTSKQNEKYKYHACTKICLHKLIDKYLDKHQIVTLGI